MKSNPSPRLTWKTFPWHVFFFAIYPVVAMLANNITQVLPGVVWAPLGISLLASGLLLLLLRQALRDWLRAGLLTAILLLLFFSYGHIYNALKGVQLGSFFLFRHRTLVPLWTVLAGLGIWAVIRKQMKPQSITVILNVVALGLLVLPSLQIATSLWKQQAAFREAAAGSAVPGEPLPAAAEQPDIYYIILDAYGRSDILDQVYHYDNSEFIQNLEDMGFYVARCSQANYGQTELSLGSSLNYNYLDMLDDRVLPGSTDRAYLWPLVKNGALRQFLEARGYRTVAFETGFYWTQLDDAAFYFRPTATGFLNEFDTMLLRSTAGRILLDLSALNVPDAPTVLARQRTSFVLAQLPQLSAIEGPKFVFAHLIIPHPPFVFGPDGEEVDTIDLADMTPQDYADGYVGQAIFINREIERVVAEIIANSPIPPVIIIQGDHGPTWEIDAKRMGILNAYYLPGADAPLYESITPVNTFRVILDAYFGQELPLLPDISRYSTYEAPYDFLEIPNDCSDRQGIP